MGRVIQKRWQRLANDAVSYQEMSAFFWLSQKTSDDEKWFLNNQLISFEEMLKRKDEYNNTQAEMAAIRMELVIDAVQLFARSHPALKEEYELTLNKQDAYRQWLQTYIVKNAPTELHIIGDSLPLKKWRQLSQNEKVRS